MFLYCWEKMLLSILAFIVSAAHINSVIRIILWLALIAQTLMVFTSFLRVGQDGKIDV